MSSIFIRELSTVSTLMITIISPDWSVYKKELEVWHA